MSQAPKTPWPMMHRGSITCLTQRFSPILTLPTLRPNLGICGPPHCPCFPP
jgi:hypothetical protein